MNHPTYRLLRIFGFLGLLFAALSPAFAQKTPAASPQKSAPAKPATALPPSPQAPSAGNPATRDTAILKLFDKGAAIKWTKLFKGRMDDGAIVDISLGFDGKNCRGYLTYAKSRTRFKLEGTLDTGSFRLEERDMARSLTGRLTGVINGRHLEAEWTNADNTIGSKLDADEVPPGQVTNMNCSDNKWSSRYITRYNNARCDMVLVRTQNGALDGFLWVESDGRTYRLKGELKPDGSYEMEALTASDRLAAMLSGNLKPGQNTDCNWTGSGERRQFKFILKDHFLLGCYEYADYASSYDVLYPRTPCASCNTWLDEQVNNWVERCKTTFSTKKMPLTATNRNAQRAGAWPEIGCWTENLFSGCLTFTDTWTEQAQGIAYNFDLKTGKQVQLEDIFLKSFNYKSWLADFSAKEMPKLPSFASDPKYREWLSKEGFPLIIIRREGLELSTLFHPQYGRQTLFVPYNNLRAYLRKDSVIGEFIK